MASIRFTFIFATIRSKKAWRKRKSTLYTCFFSQHHHVGCTRLSPSSPCRRPHLYEERCRAQLLPHTSSPRRTSQLLSRQGLHRQPLRTAHATHRASGSRAEARPATCCTQHIPQATVRLWRTLPTCFILTLHRVTARCLHRPCLGIKGSSQSSCITGAVCPAHCNPVALFGQYLCSRKSYLHYFART